MEHQPNSKDETVKKAMQLAQSKEGQQIVHMLRRDNEKFETAMAQASSGDYSQIASMIQNLLKNPEAKELLKQLGRQ